MFNPEIKNVAFYKFFHPQQEWAPLRAPIREKMKSHNIKGTILLSTEGINASLTGIAENLDTFLPWLLHTIGIQNIVLKSSLSKKTPFTRALVKIKKAIVTAPGSTPISLPEDSAPYLSPEKFHQWLAEGKKIIVLDTRNDYEFDIGHFKDSKHLGTKHFAHFEKDLEKTPTGWKDTPIVTFCTGGIRCEKAAPLMLKKGFREVYQLDGGILNYFKKMGRGFFEGGCFVFDYRVALNEKLEPTGDAMCFTCQAILSPEEQRSPHYQAPKHCPHCFEKKPAERNSRKKTSEP